MISSNGIRGNFKSFFDLVLHLHPRKINVRTLPLTHTFGLGGMAALLVLTQFISGLLLKFHYKPSPENAYNSIVYIREELLFGSLIRNVHHWSAILLLCIAALHLLRVFFTGAYRKPRHTTWMIGVVLLTLVVLFNFTGYLLPWDQLSYWAVTISTGLVEYIPLIGDNIRETLLGGMDVSNQALLNFYNLHTGIMPFLIIILMVYHFWKIRKAGGVIVAEKYKMSPKVDANPHLITRELVVALVLAAIIMVLSIVWDAPLAGRANPSVSPNPAKAPWYFMGLQELLIHFHPFFAVVIPLTIIFGVFYLPFMKFQDQGAGIWFISEKGKKTVLYSAVISGFAAIVFILLSEFLPDPGDVMPSVSSIITTGIFPFTGVVLSIYVYLNILKRKVGMSRAEYIQSLFVILVVSYSVLSITGIFFRGEGMKLIWPWIV